MHMRLNNKLSMGMIRGIIKGLETIMSITITTEDGPSTKKHQQKKMKMKISKLLRFRAISTPILSKPMLPTMADSKSHSN